ncbi:MAG TPA: hypothetical protein VLA96_05950 [Terriglobales bacterium]|nr:hypothetical protein [Terriglobales bacterium]
MPKVIAIPLLLLLLAIASGTGPVLCATACAVPATAHATPPAMMAHGHHHQAPPRTRAVGASGAPHCGKAAQPAVAEKALPQAQPAVVVRAMVGEVAAPVASFRAHKQHSAAPPGPPLRHAPLRI